MQQLTTPLRLNDTLLTTTTERTVTFLNGQYNTIVDEMFSFHDKRQMRRSTKFLGALRETLTTIEYPTIDEVWAQSDLEYTDSTKKQNEKRIRHTGWLDGDVFGARFWREYQKRWSLITATKGRLTTLKNECHMRHEYDVERGFDYGNTMEVICANPSVIYNLNGLTPTKIDYFDTHFVQIVRMNHVGGNPIVQLPLTHHYKCGKCGTGADVTRKVKTISCGECDGVMVPVPTLDTVRPAYASQVMTDDRNTISIISLTKIPPGEFIGAVFLCKNKTDYYLFMISAEEIAPVCGTIDIRPDTHAIWQLIDMIDNIHDEQIGKHINGMDWYKAAILLAYLDNRSGNASSNILMIGGTGLAKTSTARLYIATITSQQKLQPVIDLSGPGLRGATTHIKIGENTMSIHEPGLLSRHYMVVLDELLSTSDKKDVLPTLKSTLGVNEMSVEVAGNRSTIPKTATAIATSNRIPEVVAKQGSWMLKWMDAKHMDLHATFSIASAQEAMEEEWMSRELEWMTGLPFADLNRYTLIFFPYDESNEITAQDIDGADEKLGETQLAKMLYTPAIDEFLNFHGKLQVTWKKDTARVVEFVRSVRRSHEIHSKQRFGNRIVGLLVLSAKINGRTELADEDFDFVRELWSKTGNRIHIADLACNNQKLPIMTPKTKWTIETIKREIRDQMDDYTGSARYHNTAVGFSLIADRIIAMGAEAGLVEHTVTKYRENPNQ